MHRNMPITALPFFMALILASFAGNSHAAESHIQESRTTLSRYQQIAGLLGLPSEFPNIVVFDTDGSCVLRKPLDADWSVDELDPETWADVAGNCELFHSDGPGAETPSESSFRQIHLTVLDEDSCGDCEAAEIRLRDFVHERDGEWVMKIRRVYAAD